MVKTEQKGGMMAKQGDYHPERVKIFGELKSVREFGGGQEALRVWLLEGEKVVAKQFDAKDEKQLKNFKREIQHMKILKGCEFVPRLLAVDKKNKIIYTSYAGEKPTEYTKDLKKQVRTRIEQLRTKYKLARTFYERLDGLPPLSSLAINKNGKLSIVDLGPPFHTI